MISAAVIMYSCGLYVLIMLAAKVAAHTVPNDWAKLQWEKETLIIFVRVVVAAWLSVANILVLLHINQ